MPIDAADQVERAGDELAPGELGVIPGRESHRRADAQDQSTGDIITAPFAVRLDGATTYDATLQVSTEASTENLTGLTYQLVQTESFGCEAAATTTLVPAGTALGTTPQTPSVSLAEGTDEAEGAPVNLCFTVTAGDGLIQRDGGSTVWEFTATSDA